MGRQLGFGIFITRCRYLNWMHGIEELTEDTIDSSVANLHLTGVRGAEQPSSPVAFSLPRVTRVSLTMRYVPKVLPCPPAHRILLIPLLTVTTIRF
jgi:hypothetical protein